MTEHLSVDPIACRGHGLCAELLPEHIRLDEWGYPVLDGREVPRALRREARRAVRDCPALALRLEAGPSAGAGTGSRERAGSGAGPAAAA